MSRVSCVEHPARDPFVVIRKSYLLICEGDHATAAVLSALEHWTNSRLSSREERGWGDAWVFRPVREDEGKSTKSGDLVSDLLGLFGRNKIIQSLAHLERLGFMEKRRNPKLGWDRTWQYRLNLDAIQAALDRLKSHCPNSDDGGPNSDDASSRFGESIVRNGTSNTTDSVPDSEIDSAAAAAASGHRGKEEEPPAPSGQYVEIDDPLDCVEYRVFVAWKVATENPTARFTDRRRQVINRAWSHFDEEELIRAINVWRLSPFHRGENKTGRIFNRIEDLLRDDETIEELLALAASGYSTEDTPAALVARFQARNRDDLDAELMP